MKFIPTRAFSWPHLMVVSLLLTLMLVVAPQIPWQSMFKPDELRLIDLHSIDWAPKENTVRSGRDDPHFELVLPWWARATRELNLVVEPIWGNVGTFQFFYIPVDSSELYFREGMVVNVDAKIYGGPYVLKVSFPSWSRGSAWTRWMERSSFSDR